MITPIEMISMAPKSQEASIVHHGENARMTAQQQGGMQQVENQARQSTQQTVRATHAENPEYRYDAKEQSNNSYSGGQKKKKQQDEKKDGEKIPKDYSKGGFDIRI